MKSCFYRIAILAPLLVAAPAISVEVYAADSTVLSQELDLTLGAVANSGSLRNHMNDRFWGEINSDAKYVASPSINKDLLLRVGAEWQRFSFPAGRPFQAPATLVQANAVVGFDYQVGDQWLMRTEVQPGLYGDFIHSSWRCFDAPVALGFAYLVDADLQWFFGLRVDARSQYPVLPALGVRWKYTDVWTLDLQLPNPRVEYDVNGAIQAYLGAAVFAGTYVVGDHYGDDRSAPQLNNARLDYLEVRLGPGFTWKVRPDVTLDLEGGYVLYRNWDFFDQHVNLNS